MITSVNMLNTYINNRNLFGSVIINIIKLMYYESGMII